MSIFFLFFDAVLNETEMILILHVNIDDVAANGNVDSFQYSTMVTEVS